MKLNLFTNKHSEVNVNILINYTGRIGAGPSYGYEMAKGFIDNEVNVYAIISSNVSNLDKWKALPIKKLLILDTYTDKKEFFFATIKLFIKERKNIEKFFYDIQFDAIYVPMQTYWSYAISKCFQGVPVYFTLHDPKAHSGESFFNRLFYCVTKYEIRGAHRIILLSSKFIPYVQSHFHKQEILVIPHGAFFNYKKSVVGKKIVEYSNDKINFLFFGRIEEYKGLDILLSAYKCVEEKYPKEVSLVVAGRGDIDKYMHQMQNIKNLTLLNFLIPDEHIRDLFSGNNVVTVLPYKDATQSGVIATAAMFDSLIVASDTGGLTEQLQDGRLGVLFTCNSVEDLKIKMCDIVKNYPSYRKYITASRKHINSLSWSNLSKIIINDIIGLNEK